MTVQLGLAYALYFRSVKILLKNWIGSETLWLQRRNPMKQTGLISWETVSHQMVRCWMKSVWQHRRIDWKWPTWEIWCPRDICWSMGAWAHTGSKVDPTIQVRNMVVVDRYFLSIDRISLKFSLPQRLGVGLMAWQKVRELPPMDWLA